MGRAGGEEGFLNRIDSQLALACSSANARLLPEFARLLDEIARIISKFARFLIKIARLCWF